MPVLLECAARGKLPPEAPAFNGRNFSGSLTRFIAPAVRSDANPHRPRNLDLLSALITDMSAIIATT
jgi:hypothetical protein